MIIINVNSDYPYFSQTSSIEGILYQFIFSWNERDERWRMTITDMEENIIFNKIKIVPFIPLTSRYKIDDIYSGDILGYNIKSKFDMPSRTSLGKDFKLFYFDKNELKALNL